MAEKNIKEGDSDIDLYCDLEEVEDGSEINEEFSDVNVSSVPDITTLFAENECRILFSEDGKKTKIRIKKQVESNEGAAVNQSPVKDLDLFTDVVTEKFVQAEQEKLERKTLISHNMELKKLNSQLEAEINMVMNKNRTLMKNICALYKTAKEEISRKDVLIAELREKNDGMIFRRTRLLGAGSGPNRRSSKFYGHGNVVADDSQQLNGKHGGIKTKGHDVRDLCADDQVPMEKYNSNSCRNPGQRPSSDVSALSSFGNTHKHTPERRKKLPKAFQDPEKHFHRRHSSHKPQRKRRKCKMTSRGMSSDSEGSVDSHYFHSKLSGNSSGSDANHLFHETFGEQKKCRVPKKRHKKSVLSNEELRHIYSDYQRSLNGSKSVGVNIEKEKSKTSSSTNGNFNKGNINCDSEQAVVARNDLFKKLLSYERPDSLQESEMKQKNTELKTIISSTSNVEDFTQLYAKYLAQWALSSIKSSGDTNSFRSTSDDSDENSTCDVENYSDYPGEGDYEEYYDEGNEYYSRSKYVDLDRPDDYFYSTPQKNFLDHIMEEKARQVHMYCGKDCQSNRCAVDSSKLIKRCNGEEVLSASHLPEALKSDSLKLFSYQGKPVPIAVKKKVLGYAKSPKKAAKNKDDSDISTSKGKNELKSPEKPS